MFDIITGLFGGLFYSGVLLKEKAENQIWKKKQQDFEQTYWEISGKLEDVDLEMSYRQYVYSGEHRDEIYNRLHDDLVFAFGENYRDIFQLPHAGHRLTDRENKDAIWAVNLLMAKKGKVDRGNKISFLILYGRHEEDIKLCQRIEMSLQKFIPEAELVVYNSMFDKYRDPGQRHSIYLNFKHTGTGGFRRLW